MHQPHVNSSSSSSSNNNHTKSALDCAESRTVRTINTKKAQQHRQLAAFSRSSKAAYSHSANVLAIAAPLLSDATRLDNCNFTIGNTNVTCPMPAMKAATNIAPAATLSALPSARLSGKTHSPKRILSMKSVALLPIICIAILAHVSSASGRTLHGRKQILHTLERRMHHHNDLIHYERVIAPKYTAPAQHHRQRNVRSLGMSCDDMELIMQQLKNQSQISLQTLKDNVEVLYIKPRFNSTLEASLRNWSKSKLNLSHPYQKLLDRNFTKTVGSHDFSHLKNYANINELLKAELNKIYTTINMLNFVIKRLHKEIKTKEQMETSFNEGLNNITKYLEITADQIVNNLEITKSAMGALQIEKENFDEKSVTYNETISAKDWLMVVENISFTHYMDQLYTLLLRMCSPLQSKANTTNF